MTKKNGFWRKTPWGIIAVQKRLATVPQFEEAEGQIIHLGDSSGTTINFPIKNLSPLFATQPGNGRRMDYRREWPPNIRWCKFDDNRRSRFRGTRNIRLHRPIAFTASI